MKSSIPLQSTISSRNVKTFLDTLTYQVSDHRIDLFLEKGNMRETTVEVRNQLGLLIDVAMILASALAVPVAIISTFLVACIQGALVTYVGGHIKKWVGFDSLNVDSWRYTYHCYDADDYDNHESSYEDVYLVKESSHTLEGQWFNNDRDIHTQQFKASCYMLLWVDFSNPDNIY